jgi:hypothetical protein
MTGADLARCRSPGWRIPRPALVRPRKGSASWGGLCEGGLRALIIRHRFTLADLGMIALIVATAVLGTGLHDVFPNAGAETQALIFELDEIFGVCALASAPFGEVHISDGACQLPASAADPSAAIPARRI